MILEAPFPSARAVAGTVLPVVGPALVWGFDSKGRMGRVRAPLLVIHGSRDEVIPLFLGRELFGAANEPKRMWVVEGARHNDLVEMGGTAYVERLRSFYSR
ncbi:MAG: alpha/beta hydrolase [Bryobacterales bacterium]|nr:alpha/beta hydrolase [Bryobacterales bacterium]